MAPVYKVALIQFHSKPLDLEHNFQRAASFVRDAAKQGADLAVLPEFVLSGWTPKAPKFQESVKAGSTYLAQFQALAAECKICLVPGTILEDNANGEVENDLVQNTTYFISSDGEILGKYHKKNVWIPEREYIASSTMQPHEVIDTPLGKVGLLICWDLAFPEAFRELIAQGAQIIIIPAFWALLDSAPHGPDLNKRTEELFLDSFITARAFENTCAVVFVNGGDPADVKAGDETMAGMSRVGLPFIGALGEQTKDTSKEGMSVVDMDLELIRKAEETYQVRADISSERWHYSYRHEQYAK